MKTIKVKRKIEYDKKWYPKNVCEKKKQSGKTYCTCLACTKYTRQKYEQIWFFFINIIIFGINKKKNKFKTKN